MLCIGIEYGCAQKRHSSCLTSWLCEKCRPLRVLHGFCERAVNFFHITCIGLVTTLRRRRFQAMASGPSDRESQQVMGAQRTTSATTPLLEGEIAGPQYAAATENTASQATEAPGRADRAPRGPVMPNGVDPQRVTGYRDEPPLAASRSPYGPGEGPTVRAEEAIRTEQPEGLQRLHGNDGAGVSPGVSSGFLSVGTASPTTLANPESAMDQPQQAERTFASASMEYHYAGAEPGQPVVRWVARLTEFLRSTTSRTNGLQGRVLGGLGFTTTQGTQPFSPQQQRIQQDTQHDPQQQRPQWFQATVERTPSRVGATSPWVNFSPPEALPEPPAQAMVPTMPMRQLFTDSQADRLQGHPREAPLLYPRPPSSTSSSEIQAEVQRQLQGYLAGAASTATKRTGLL